MSVKDLKGGVVHHQNTHRKPGVSCIEAGKVIAPEEQRRSLQGVQIPERKFGEGILLDQQKGGKKIGPARKGKERSGRVFDESSTPQRLKEREN